MAKVQWQASVTSGIYDPVQNPNGFTRMEVFDTEKAAVGWINQQFTADPRVERGSVTCVYVRS